MPPTERDAIDREILRELRQSHAEVSAGFERIETESVQKSAQQFVAIATTFGEMEDVKEFLVEPGEDESGFALLALLECRGEGLRPFSEDAVTAPGDLLIDSKRSAWLVIAVDQKGRVAELAGSPRGRSKRDLALHWRRDGRPRAWAGAGASAGGSPASGYNDLPAALNHLVRLWGSETEGGKNGRGGVVAALLAGPGVTVKAEDLGGDSTDEELIAFCEARGGLHPVADGLPFPGDVLRFDAGRWSIVLRAERKDTLLLDVIAAGLPGSAPLGETSAMVRILRDYVPVPEDRVWKPSSLIRGPRVSS